jgi:hypothetical protein
LWNATLILAERLSQEPLQTVSHHRDATRLADGDSQTRVTPVVLGNVQGQQTITRPSSVVEDRLELAVAQEPSRFRKGKTFHR